MLFNYPLNLFLLNQIMSLADRKAAPTSASTPTLAEVSNVPLKNTSTVGFPRTEIQGDEDYAFERERATTKMTPEGLKPLTKEEQHEEHHRTKELLKKFAANIFQISFPVWYSEPRSYIERISELFAFLVQKYVNKSKETADPADKLAIISVGIAAGYYLDLNTKKVFNPYLGESYVGKWENGTTVYAEQISHHPPLSVFQIYGPNNEWYCYSDPVHFDVSNSMTSLEISMEGEFHLKLNDGNEYKWEFPTVFLAGQVKGDRIVKIKSDITVYDVNNGLSCVIEVAPSKSKKRGITESRASLIYGGIKKTEKKVSKLSLHDKDETFQKTITGDYSQQLLIDGQVAWDINTDVVHRALGPIADDELLPSDVRYRIDRGLLINNNLDEADKAKTALEELQRREAKIRVSVKKRIKI